MDNSTNDEAARRLRQASKDKQLWGLLTYLLPPLVIVFLPLWLLTIRREKRRIMEVAALAGIPIEGRAAKEIRREVGEYIGSEDVTKNSYGPAVVAVVIVAIAVFVAIKILMG